MDSAFRPSDSRGHEVEFLEDVHETDSEHIQHSIARADCTAAFIEVQEVVYQYDPVFALGFVTVYDQLMEGYPSDEDMESSKLMSRL